MHIAKVLAGYSFAVTAAATVDKPEILMVSDKEETERQSKKGRWIQFV